MTAMRCLGIYHKMMYLGEQAAYRLPGRARNNLQPMHADAGAALWRASIIAAVGAAVDVCATWRRVSSDLFRDDSSGANGDVEYV